MTDRCGAPSPALPSTCPESNLTMPATAPPRKAPIRSDSLKNLRDLNAAYPWLAEIISVFQVRLVIDANIVIGDLRWLIKKRTSPDARTTLQEVMAAGTVVAYAPTFLDEELRTHFPRLAEECDVPVERFETAWADYRTSVHFFEPTDVLDAEAAAKVRDPKDLPYVQLRSEIGAAAVYSRDKDVAAMGAPVVKESYLRSLRDYSRAAPVTLTLTVSGSVVAVASAATAYHVLRCVYGLMQKIRDLPRGLQIALATVAVVALLHPGSRSWLAQAIKALPAHLRTAFDTVAPAVGYVVTEAFTAQEEANAALARARQYLPGSPRYRLGTHILAVCVAADRPLFIPEIERELRAAGCKARSKSFPLYLRRALQRDERFVADGVGRWSVATS